MKYGLEWDDTMGPCGVFFGLRQIQDIFDICHDMEKLCPDAWLISYSDPMAMIGWAINDYTHIKNIGICPNQHGLAVELARYASVPFDEISYWLAGITHFSWYIEFKWKGKDAYPRLREKFKGDVCSWPDAGSRYDPVLGHQVGFDLVAVEIFKKFGYFTNGTSGDLAKYVHTL